MTEQYEIDQSASRVSGSGGMVSGSRTPICRAIDWLQSYVDEHPHIEAAKEARSIINALKAVHQRPSLDELLVLIAQIAKTDQGLQEINRAKIQMSQPVEKTGHK